MTLKRTSSKPSWTWRRRLWHIRTVYLNQHDHLSLRLQARLHFGTKKHNKAYHLLLLSLSKNFKALTINCDDLCSTWKRLEQHFEGKAAADIIAAERQLEHLTISDSDNLVDVLNQIRMIRNALASAGSPISDEKLFIAVTKKLPRKLDKLSSALLWGPEDRQTWPILEQQLLSYNKNFPSNLNYQQANNVKHTKKFCDHCKLSGHRIEEYAEPGSINVRNAAKLAIKKDDVRPDKSPGQIGRLANNF